jgi:hypothetical protein
MTSTSEPAAERPRPKRPAPNPVSSEVRRQVQSRRFPANAACVLCGETKLETLRQEKGTSHLLEDHHVAGRANDKALLAVLCLNCHAKATVIQHEVGALPPGKRASCLEAMDLALRSLGTFFELLAAACYRWSAQLTQVIATLDEHLPAWRTLPGMP